MFFNENLPIYIQIMNMVKKRIVIKELKEGEKLPSVRELSTELKVNPNTIQRSYQELEREDLVFTQRGMGTFVTEDIDVIDNLKKTMALGLVDSFIKDMESLGFSIGEISEIINNRAKEG
ncbi:MAG: GntR family transcriptional regulator [Tissierellaceae bacterium]|nr:GntR family transcriptional regulator [Tissierellaceae bacterium]